MKANKFQNQLALILKKIFGKEMVFTEWDSLKHDGHGQNHLEVYGPRIDIAVGPFNPCFPNHDVGIDDTELMKKHLLTQRLYTEENKGDTRGSLDSLWNDLSRCYLAIEIEFSGSSKHILGSIINAASSGSLGIIVGNKNTIEKIRRNRSYFLRLENYERVKTNYLSNLWVFEDKEFVNFLKSFL